MLRIRKAADVPLKGWACRMQNAGTQPFPPPCFAQLARGHSHPSVVQVVLSRHRSVIASRWTFRPCFRPSAAFLSAFYLAGCR